VNKCPKDNVHTEGNNRYEWNNQNGDAEWLVDEGNKASNHYEDDCNNRIAPSQQNDLLVLLIEINKIIKHTFHNSFIISQNMEKVNKKGASHSVEWLAPVGGVCAISQGNQAFQDNP
jgi:hypothetical protein